MPLKYSPLVAAGYLARGRFKKIPNNQSVVDSLNLLAKGQGDEAVGLRDWAMMPLPPSAIGGCYDFL